MEQHTKYSKSPYVFQEKFRPQRKFFYPACTARSEGYFPRSHWTKCGREVIEPEQPALAVARMWETRDPRYEEIIVAWNDYNHYLVTTESFEPKIKTRNCWPVYHETQTRIVSNKKQKRLNAIENRATETTTNPPRDTTPYVTQTINSVLEDRQIPPPQPPAPPPDDTTPYVMQTINNGTGVWLTIPKSLEVPETHWDCEDEIYYYCHTILQGLFSQKHDRDRTVRINRKLMQSIIVDTRKETKARQFLLDHGIIYTDHVYSQGNFSKSYGVNPIYAKRLTRWEVTKPRLASKINLARVRRMDIRKQQEAEQAGIVEYLEEWAKRVTIDLDACRFVLERSGSDGQTYNLIPAENIFRRDYQLTRDDYGRVHSPFTQLWRPFRKHLRHGDQTLCELDIRNSQIVFLVKLLKEELLAKNQQPTSDQFAFISLVERGEIYDHLLAIARERIPDYMRRKKTRQQQVDIWYERFLVHVCGSVRPRTKDEWQSARNSFLRHLPVKSIEVVPTEVVRDDFKRMLFSDVFYGRVQAITPLTQVFRDEFPTVHGFICDQKASGYEELARNMQRAESNFMIDTVCLRLKNHHPEIPVVTVHDSILTTAKHLPTVRRILVEEFARIDLHPALKESG